MSDQPSRSNSSGFIWGFLAFIAVTLLANKVLMDIIPPPVQEPANAEKELTTDESSSDTAQQEKTEQTAQSEDTEEPVKHSDANRELRRQVSKTKKKQTNQIEKPQYEKVTITLEDQLRKVELTNQGARVLSATLKVNDSSGIRGRDLKILKPFSDEVPHFGLDIDRFSGQLNNRNWKIKSKRESEVVFELEHEAGFIAEKTITLQDHYLIDVSVTFNFMSAQEPMMVSFYGMAGLEEDENAYDPTYHAEGFVWGKRKKAKSAYIEIGFSDLESRYEDGREFVFYDDQEYGAQNMPMNWIGCRTKYLMSFLRDQDDTDQRGFLQAVAQDKRSEPTKIALGLSKSIKEFNEPIVFNYQTYVGPRHEATIEKIDEDLTQTFKGGMLGPIKFVMLMTVEFFYKIFNSYGLAIILLTLCVRLVIHPITRRSQMKMQEYQESMVKLKPKLEALKKKYGNDRQAFAKAQMKLMREHNVTGGMLGGCLPMLLQFPIFIALFFMLQELIELRGTTFMWIADLSQPDKLFEVNFFIDYFNLLPVLNCAVMMLQFKRNAKRQTTMTPEQEMQQKMMLFIMPLMMLFMFYSFPAGLYMYWITSAMVGIIESEIIRKKLKNKTIPVAANVKKKPSK